MLRHLEIRNIALIDKLSLEFGPGMCVLTGETGAGKSIIIDSINAVLGMRLQKDLIRTGADSAGVTAVFTFEGDVAGAGDAGTGAETGRAEPVAGWDGAKAGAETGGAESMAGWGGAEAGAGDAAHDAETGSAQNAGAQTSAAAAGAQSAAELAGAVLREYGFDAEPDGSIIVSREILASGRSYCRVNGRLVPSAMAKAIGEVAVDLHGQQDNHSLLRREKHIDLIDNFGGGALLAAKGEYAALHASYARLKREIDALRMDEAERIRQADMLAFQTGEIRAGKLKPGEDEQLEAAILRYSNAEKISSALGGAHRLLSEGGLGLDGGAGDAAAAGEFGFGAGGGAPAGAGGLPAMEGIRQAASLLAQIGRFGDAYAELSGKLMEISYQLEDIVASVRAQMGAAQYDPKRLDAMGGRLSAIERLKKKYGGSIREIHAFYKNALARLSELAGSEQRTAGLEQELAAVRDAMSEKAAQLTRMRERAAGMAEKGVVRELAELEMKNTRLKVVISSTDDPDQFTAKGRDQVEFLFSANVGEELKPLSKIASGGEMSRFMLALKSVLAGADSIPTMIFDEIDAGISGRAAGRVAEKMHALSAGRQIICVTHLAQIACMADEQLLIEKSERGGATLTSVARLPYEGRVAEISRLLGGGAPTEASARLASELLDRAAAFKSAHAAR
jgi:DNA repair protein RecN (Recombination protein N)